MRLLTILLMLLCAGTQAYAGIYRHIDKDGRVVFTDQPPDNAEPVELPPINRVPGGQPRNNNPTAPKPSEELRYQRLELTGINDGDTLRNPEGPITLGASTDIPLQPGHRLVFIHNGRDASEGAGGYTLSQIERGSHTFVAEIRNADGEVLIRSAPLSLQVHRTSTPPARITPR